MKLRGAIYGIFMAVIVSFLTIGCQKAPINGNLDGFWQVMSVSPQPEDPEIDLRAYYGFYMHVCSLTFYDFDFMKGNMRFDGDTLWMEFPLVENEWQTRVLRQFGIYTNPVLFNVEYLDKNKMILKDGDVTVTLRKF